MGCFPVRLSLPIQGVVLDKETDKPVPGAAVGLSVTSSCFNFVHATTKRLQLDKAQSNQGGRFFIGGGVNNLLPNCLGWENKIVAAAPGYYVNELYPVDSIGFGFPLPIRWLISVDVPLTRIKYLRHLRSYQKYGAAYFLSYPFTHRDLDTHSKSLGYKVIGQPGIFAAVENAAFIRLKIEGNKVYAISSSDGKIYGWDNIGDPVKLIGRGGVLQDEKHIDKRSKMIAGLRRNISSWKSKSSSKDQQTRLVLEGVLRNESDIECIAPVYGGFVNNLSSVIITNKQGRHVVFLVAHFLPVPVKTAVFRASFAGSHIDGKVTACTADRNYLFVAFEKKGIRKFLLPGKNTLAKSSNQKARLLFEDRFFKASRSVSIDAPGGPRIFEDLEPGLDYKTIETVLYGVSGGDKIYRFEFDGTPDQQIEFE